MRIFIAASMLAAATVVTGADATAVLDTKAESAVSPAAESQAASSPANSKAKQEDPLVIKVMALAIGLVGTVLGIGIAILAVWTEHKKLHDLITFCHQERMSALEKGLDPPPFPPELIHEVTGKDESPKPYTPVKGLKAGLMWLAIGIGLATYLSLQHGPNFHPSISAIPVGIGVVYLICYAIERRHRQQA